MASFDADFGLDGLDEEVIELFAALPASRDGGPDTLAPLLADLALGALSDLAVDGDEADLAFGAVVGRLDPGRCRLSMNVK